MWYNNVEILTVALGNCTADNEPGKAGCWAGL